jgi:hypothetical protein
MLESRRDSPQNTRVVVESIGFVDGEDNIETTLRIASLQSSCWKTIVHMTSVQSKS